MGIKDRDGQDISKPMNGATNGPMDGTDIEPLFRR